MSTVISMLIFNNIDINATARAITTEDAFFRFQAGLKNIWWRKKCSLRKILLNKKIRSFLYVKAATVQIRG